MLDVFLSGGPVMYPLLLCSLISLTVIIERVIFWLTIRKQASPDLLNDVMTLCESGDWEAIRQKTAGTKDFIIKVIITGILHRRYSMIKAMEASAADELKRMGRYMGVLDTMITVAPLLGILGTVIGIIQSFDVLGTAGIEHPEIVTAGIAQALITTAAGLAIAILSVLPFNYFNSLVEGAAIQIEKYATSLEIVYQNLIRKDPFLEESRP
ncbi:MAG: MotA/TolQ/ExbB proton channel family protein [Desulfobacterales bacterium]